jgi:hypothetical protein
MFTDPAALMLLEQYKTAALALLQLLLSSERSSCKGGGRW